MPLHPCKSHTEGRQSTSESTVWPRYKLQEHNSMKINKKIACKRDKNGNAFNNWRTVSK